MKEIVATITSKGQVTIPAAIRKQLGLDTGDKLAFVLDDDGEVRVRPATFPDLASLRGAAGSLGRPMSWEEMREIAREDYLRGDQDAT